MKHMLMMFGDQTQMADKSPEWIRSMITFMKQIDVDLAESGELVFQQGLADFSSQDRQSAGRRRHR